MRLLKYSKDENVLTLIIAWIVFCCFILKILPSLLFIADKTFCSNYNDWAISEWLINYEGGFVRRGIIGQLLLETTKISLYDVRIAIAGIIFISSVLILYLLIRIFKEEGWSLLILPTGFFLGFTLFNLWGRRDFLSLLMTFLIFLIYRNLRRDSRIWYGFVLFYSLSLFQLLIHEASFFYTFPILMLDFYQHYYRIYSKTKSAVKCFTFFSPILLTMGLVCIFKGDNEIAQTIWDSWRDVLITYSKDNDVTQIGYAVDALTWSLEDTIELHLIVSYFGQLNYSLWNFPLVVFIIFSAYYLTTRINTVNLGLYPSKEMNHCIMSDIILVQFIAMIPMFGILSCDWGRTIPYWLISSIFFYSLFKKDYPVFPKFVHSISRNVQCTIDNHNVLKSPYFYILLILLTPVPWYHAPSFTMEFANTIQQNIYFLIEKYATSFF